MEVFKNQPEKKICVSFCRGKKCWKWNNECLYLKKSMKTITQHIQIDITLHKGQSCVSTEKWYQYPDTSHFFPLPMGVVCVQSFKFCSWVFSISWIFRYPHTFLKQSSAVCDASQRGKLVRKFSRNYVWGRNFHSLARATSSIFNLNYLKRAFI